LLKKFTRKMHPKKLLINCFSLCCVVFLFPKTARSQTKFRIDPPYWFTQMGSKNLQLLLYGEKITHISFKTDQPDLIQITDTCNSLSSNYKILYLTIPENFIGTFNLLYGKNFKSKIPYEIKAKPKSGKPITAADRMYLIMPDRFANGNNGNDNAKDMVEKADRKALHGRHGGDIAGVASHLGHIKSLGFNALWMTPLLENNQPEQSYHGYACTDHYRIDPRYGTLNDYANLAQQCRDSGVKFILDCVYNHIGNRHFLYRDMVSPSWFNSSGDTFRRTNYRVAALSDPYAAKSEVEGMTRGWFDTHMPDLNQDNLHLAHYLIQNTLWWISVTNASGVRIDTYPYSQPAFLEKLNLRLKAVYPEIFVFGESWEHTITAQAGFAPNNIGDKNSIVPDAATDFQFCFGLEKALNEPFGWNTGLTRLYYILASDRLYKHPELLVTFADNHDLNRMHATFGQNVKKTQLALALTYMCRGIPCVFYGTEVLMRDTGAHGAIRKDFPGGWPGDSFSGFDAMNPYQVMYEFIQSLSSVRAEYAQLFIRGKRTHYIPKNGVYAFFIEGEKDVLGIFANQSNPQFTPNFKLYPDIEADWDSGKVIVSNENAGQPEKGLTPNGIMVLHFRKK